MAYNKADWVEMQERRRKRLGIAVGSVLAPKPSKIPDKIALPAQIVELPEVPEPTFGSQMRRKVCAKCGNKKAIDQFPKHTTSSDGLASYCKVCKNELNVQRRQKDPVARIKHYTVTRLQNEWGKENLPEDLYTNLEHYLGYKLWELKAALKKDLKEREGITLQEAFEKKYHLDHRIPHTSFKYEEIGDATFKECWAISNLWLIPASVNLAKGSQMNFTADEVEDDEDELENGPY